MEPKTCTASLREIIGTPHVQGLPLYAERKGTQLVKKATFTGSFLGFYRLGKFDESCPFLGAFTRQDHTFETHCSPRFRRVLADFQARISSRYIFTQMQFLKPREKLTNLRIFNAPKGTINDALCASGR